MIINGTKIANALMASIADKVKNLDRPPSLATILVGEDAASKIYIANKSKACNKVGFRTQKIQKPSDISQAQLLAEIECLNNDDTVDGILVQLPLPPHLNLNQVIDSIHPSKDVDGFHHKNMGKLMQNKALLRPCTPKGIITLLTTIGIDLVGKYAVVVGASMIVGRPLATELLNAQATVTICNSKTQNLSEKIKSADIVIVAIGSPKMIKGDWIKKGAVVIDVGINRLANGKLVGDVDFDNAKNNAAWITPVPGGVGPLTIASLLENTLIAYENRRHQN